MKTKKLVSLLAAFTMLLSLFAVMPASAAPNLFTHENLDFEEGTTAGWGGNTPWTVEASKEYAHNGEYSLKISSETEVSATQTLYYNSGYGTLDTTKEYVFSAWVNIPEAMTTSKDGGVQLYVKDGAGKNTFGTVLLDATNGWEKTQLSFTPTAETATFYIRLRGTTKGVIYIDDVMLQKQEDLDADAKAEAEEKAAKKFILVSDYTKLYDDEMVLDMEGTLSDVMTNSNTSMDSASSPVYQGSASAIMTITADGEGYLQTKSRPAFQQDVEYEASVWAYLPADAAVTQLRLFMDLGSGKSATLDGASGVRYVQRKVTITDAEKGKWLRIPIVFTPAQTVTPSSIRLMATGSANAVIYFDDLKIVQKQSQYATLRITKPVTLDGGASMEADIASVGAGTFNVTYDFHKAADKNAEKVLIAGIYKDTGAGKQLMEVKTVTVGATDASVTIPMTGVETPDETYSLKIMYWDSLTGMFGYRTTEFAF